MTEPVPQERALRIRGLGKEFGANTVLDGIDLDVGRGETVCVLGLSGSGKSTLLRCINWLEHHPTNLGHSSGKDAR